MFLTVMPESTDHKSKHKKEKKEKKEKKKRELEILPPPDKSPIASFFAVYDGHGGKKASDFASQKLIYDWKNTRGPDGMKLDAAGRLFVAAGLNRQNPPYEVQDKPTAGIYVFSPAGELLDFAAIPRDETTNCAFGGDDLKTLFVTAGGTLWSVRVATPGKPVWPQSK